MKKSAVSIDQLFCKHEFTDKNDILGYCRLCKVKVIDLKIVTQGANNATISRPN